MEKSYNTARGAKEEALMSIQGALKHRGTGCHGYIYNPFTSPTAQGSAESGGFLCSLRADTQVLFEMEEDF